MLLATPLGALLHQPAGGIDSRTSRPPAPCYVLKYLLPAAPLGALPQALEQIAYADRIILNKTDLVSLCCVRV